MITFKINKLIDKIANEDLSYKDEITYYILSLLLITFQMQYFLFMGIYDGYIFWTEFTAIITTTITGCYICWISSRKDIYIISMVCISTLSTLYTFALNIVLGLGLYFSFKFLNLNEDIGKYVIIYEIIGFLIFSSLLITYWLINYYSIKKIAKISSEKKKFSEPAREPKG